MPFVNGRSLVVSDAELESTMLSLIAQRGEQSSACPSEVARTLLPKGWRELMPRVREAALRLCQQGRLDISQKGVSVPKLDTLRGPIRIRQPVAVDTRRFAGESPDCPLVNQKPV